MVKKKAGKATKIKHKSIKKILKKAKVVRKGGEKKPEKLSVPVAKAKAEKRKPSAPLAKELISIETVEKVAKIARLNLTSDEKQRFQKDLNDILSAFKVLDEAKADEKPSFQPYDIKDVLREDKEEEPLGQKALDNTKHKEKGFIKGPRVV